MNASHRLASLQSSRRTCLAAAGLLSIGIASAPLDRAFGQRTMSVPLEQFGGAARPGFDNTGPLRRAMAALSGTGGTLRLGPGEYEFSSHALLDGGAVKRPSSVAIEGAGSSRTTVRVTGTDVINQLFDASGASRVLTRSIRFVGNGVKSERAPYAGALMVARLLPSDDRDMQDIFIEDCVIDNFASAAWLFVVNESPSHVIRNVGSLRCTWLSTEGTAPGEDQISIPGHFIYFYGYRGPIEQIAVDDASMDAAYIKGGIAMVGDIDGGTVRVASLSNAGQAMANNGAPNGPGAYAVMLYRKTSGAPHNIAVWIDQMDNVYSVGIYSAGAYANQYHIGSASGQRDTRDASLYKGILAIDGGHDITARIDEVSDSRRVLMISIDGGQNIGAAAARANIVVALGSVHSLSGARDITIGAGASPHAGGVRISGNRSGPAAVAVSLRAGPGVILQGIDLTELHSSGAVQPLQIASGQIDMNRIFLPNR